MNNLISLNPKNLARYSARLLRDRMIIRNMNKSITFITGNADKAEQLSKYLNRPINHYKLDLTEIQSLDLEEVVSHKVIEAYEKIKTPVLVDDVALTITALGKLPGPFIKYFIEELGNNGICRLVNDYKSRAAVARVAIGYYSGKEVRVFIGEINGKISDMPKGVQGFGWDQIMIPEGYKQTRAEMNTEDYDATSPRRLALIKLEHYLNN